MKTFYTGMNIAFAFVKEGLESFLGGCDGLMYALISFIILDFLSGIICAIFSKSLSSEVMVREIGRKVLILALVGVGHILDAQVLGLDGVLRSVIGVFYLSTEGLSIVEHATNLGLPVPIKLKAILEQLHDHTDKDLE